MGELFLDVSERTTTIVREEIELAKVEVTEKITKLLRGSAVGAAAGTFAFLALILILVGLSFLIDDLLFDDTLWPGFLIVAAVLLLLAALAGWLAYRSIQAGSPPVPEQAIEDVKQTRAVLEHTEAPQAPPMLPGSKGRGSERLRQPAAGAGAAPLDGGGPGRSSAEIRRDLEAQRGELSASVEQLRSKVNELTDWRGQLREHRTELITAAAVAGFVVGGILALRRRRR